MKQKRNNIRQMLICGITICSVLAGAVPPEAFCAARTGEYTAAGSGTVLKIGTVQELEALRQNCMLDSWSAGKTVILTADLDLTGSGFEPIPFFSGIFDGQGHSVTGMANPEAGSVTGFFRYVGEGAIVRNLHVSGKNTPGGSASTLGGIAGDNAGMILDCSFEGTVAGKWSVGGIAGINHESGVISGCTMQGEVTAEHEAGGIAGQNSGRIAASRNDGAVNTTLVQTEEDMRNNLTSNLTTGLSSLSSFDLSSVNQEDFVDIMDIGGIAGRSEGTVSDCINTGDVGYPHTGYNVGGIVGRSNGYMVNCQNEGFVQGRKDVGGIAGQLEPEAIWTFSQDKMSRLKEELTTLNALIDQLFYDLAGGSDTLRGQAQTAAVYAEETIGELSKLTDAVSEDLGDTADQILLLVKQLKEAYRQENAQEIRNAISRLAQILSETDFSKVSVKAETDGSSDLDIRSVLNAQGDAWWPALQTYLQGKSRETETKIVYLQGENTASVLFGNEEPAGDSGAGDSGAEDSGAQDGGAQDGVTPDSGAQDSVTPDSEARDKGTQDGDSLIVNPDSGDDIAAPDPQEVAAADDGSTNIEGNDSGDISGGTFPQDPEIADESLTPDGMDEIFLPGAGDAPDDGAGAVSPDLQGEAAPDDGWIDLDGEDNGEILSDDDLFQDPGIADDGLIADGLDEIILPGEDGTWNESAGEDPILSSGADPVLSAEEDPLITAEGTVFKTQRPVMATFAVVKSGAPLIVSCSQDGPDLVMEEMQMGGPATMDPVFEDRASGEAGADIPGLGVTEAAAIGGTDIEALGVTDAAAIDGTDIVVDEGTDAAAAGGTDEADAAFVEGTDAAVLEGTDAAILEGTGAAAEGTDNAAFGTAAAGGTDNAANGTAAAGNGAGASMTVGKSSAADFSAQVDADVSLEVPNAEEIRALVTTILINGSGLLDPEALTNAASILDSLEWKAPDTEAFYKSFENLSRALAPLADEASSLVSVAAADIDAITDQMDAITDTFFDLTDNVSLDKGYRKEDISENDANQRDTAVIAECRNDGSAEADTNAGGITGSIAFEDVFDAEDMLKVSDYLLKDARYQIFSAVRSCRNTGSVSAKKEGAGGIVGMMDFGFVTDSINAGAVTVTDGSYSGGIAGHSAGTISASCSGSLISGNAYVGGIAGEGSRITNCISYSYIGAGTEHLGAVTGQADGEVSGCRYVDYGYGGIDNIGYAGSAEPVQLDGAEELGAEQETETEDGTVEGEMPPVEELPPLMSTCRVTFLVDDEIFDEVEVPFGGSIDALPEVANDGDNYWKWDDFEQQHIFRDTEVHGAYHRPVTTLATDGDVPEYLAEGIFYEGQALTVSEYTGEFPEPEDLRGKIEEKLAQQLEAENRLSGTFHVNDYEGTLKARVKAVSGGTLYLSDASGAMQEAEYEKDGSYITFPVENGGSFIYYGPLRPLKEQGHKRAVLMAAGCAAGAAALLVLLIVLRKRRKRVAH